MVFNYDFYKTLKFTENDAILMSISVWDEVIVCEAFANLFESATTSEIIMDGYLGKLGGLKLYTDGFFDHPFVQRGCAFLATEDLVLDWLRTRKINVEPVYMSAQVYRLN